jgi:hypothetical protein
MTLSELTKHWIECNKVRIKDRLLQPMFVTVRGGVVEALLERFEQCAAVKNFFR